MLAVYTNIEFYCIMICPNSSCLYIGNIELRGYGNISENKTINYIGYRKEHN
jgi:hypothetical protein